jgi:hypothetical protein
LDHQSLAPSLELAQSLAPSSTQMVYIATPLRSDDLQRLGFVRRWRSHSLIVKDGSFNGKLLDQLSFVAIQTPKTLKIVTAHFDASK